MEEYLKKSDVMAAFPHMPYTINYLRTYTFSDPSPAPLKLEAGKLYRTRNGRKAFISAIYGDTVYGAIYNTNYISSWYSDGFYEKNTISFNDLIAEWQDEPDKPQPNKLREMIEGLAEDYQNEYGEFNSYNLRVWSILREIVSLLEDRRGW